MRFGVFDESWNYLFQFQFTDPLPPSKPRPPTTPGNFYPDSWKQWVAALTTSDALTPLPPVLRLALQNGAGFVLTPYLNL